MGDSNPFHILIVITTVLIMASGAFVILAESNPDLFPTVDIPRKPEFPTLNLGNIQGNQSADFPYDQTKDVRSIEALGGGVTFDAFSPHKKVAFDNRVTYTAISVDRYATGFPPWWYRQPIYTTQGIYLGDSLSIADIISKWDGSKSTFILDYGNKDFEAWIDFKPISGTDNLIDSWNIEKGLNVRIYGNTFVASDWGAQIITYLVFGLSVLGYIALFIGYIFVMFAVFLVFLATLPYGIGAFIIIITFIAIIGAILMFIRGTKQ